MKKNELRSMIKEELLKEELSRQKKEKLVDKFFEILTNHIETGLEKADEFLEKSAKDNYGDVVDDLYSSEAYMDRWEEMQDIVMKLTSWMR